MKHDDWIEKLRDRLADSKVAPPVGLWDKIEHRARAQRRHARVVRMRWISAAAAMLLLVMVGVGYYMNRDTINRLQTDDIFIADVTDSAHDSAAGTLSSQDENSESVALQKDIKLVAQQSTVANDVADVVFDNDRADGEGLAGNIANDEAQTVETNDKRADASPNKTVNPSATKQAVVSEPKVNTSAVGHRSSSTRRRGNWSVGAYSSNMFGNGNTTNGVNAVGRDVTTYAMSKNMLKANATYYSDYREDKKHHLPVAFGLTVGYALNHCLTLTTGLVYTRVASDFVRIAGNDEVKESQTLHYVGVPLGLSYTVWRTNRFRAYASASAQADFNVAAKIETEGVRTDMPKKDNVQWSAGAAVGVQFDVLPQMGVYVEPGVRYYIDNGSRLENYFKEKEFSFGLQLGLRLNINSK